MADRELILEKDEDGVSLLVADGVIREGEASSDTLRLDCSGTLLGPADVNAHTHIYSGLAPLGMPAPTPAPENFLEILQRIWWRLDRALDEASLRASARLYVAEALLAGCGSLVDHHESPNLVDGSLEILADACDELGMRALLCYGATERNGGTEEAAAGLAECERFIKTNSRNAVRGAIGLHASFTVSDETIRQAGYLSRDLQVPLHLHLAEDQADVDDARSRGYAGPLERLEALGAIGPGYILAHGVHLGAKQVMRCAQQGAFLVQNPRSNRGNKVGYPRFVRHSADVALGTDGYPARMNEELMALVEEAVKQREKLCEVCKRADKGRDLLRAWFGGPVGASSGDRADLGAFYTEPRGSERVKHLVIDGRPVVRDGKLVHGDIEAIRAEAKEQAPRLWERMRVL